MGVARTVALTVEISHLLLWVATETPKPRKIQSSKTTLTEPVGGVFGSCKNNLLVLKQL